VTQLRPTRRANARAAKVRGHIGTDGEVVLNIATSFAGRKQ